MESAMKRFLQLCLIGCFFSSNFAQYNESSEVVTNATNYLLRFGYLGTFTNDITEPLMRFQYFANLETTGVLDESTLKQMQKPRCGLQDPRIKIRAKRFVLQGTSWKKTQLSWRLEGRGRTLDRESIRKVMHKAFQYWSDVTNLDFSETESGEPDIWVKFVTRVHGDPYGFDGEGGTLAHAFYPHNNKGLSGDVHFDDDEPYTVESPQGRNLLWVATHEIGHSIGLEHSHVREAVMYPWYTKYKPGFKLNYDDIVGIQSLYGSRVKTSTSTTTTATTPTTTPKTTTTTTPPDTTSTSTSTTTTTTTTTPSTTTSTTTTTTTTAPTTTSTSTTTTSAPPTTTSTSTPTTSAPPKTTSTSTTTTTTPPDTTSTSTTTTATPPPTTSTSTTGTTKPPITASTTTSPLKTTSRKTTTSGYEGPDPRRRHCPRAATSIIYYNTYAGLTVMVTNDNKLYFVNKNGGIRYGPVKPATFISGYIIPQNIDAAFNTKRIKNRDYTIFFAGTSYYAYQHFRYRSGPHSIFGNVLDENNPLNLTFPSWVKKIDAVMTWYRDGHTYFFSDRYYWRYDNSLERFNDGYPRLIENGWRGLPMTIDGAFSSATEKKTFFISGDNYYVFDDIAEEVTSGYPKSALTDWLKCPRRN